jgi:TRAP-type transport system periplasmic protein
MITRYVVSAALAGFALLAAQPASAQKQTLKMAHAWGPSHHMVKTQDVWIKDIEKASNGALTVEVDKAAIGSPTSQYDLVKDGVRDIVWFVPGYTPGRFQLYQVAELPFICPNASTCAPALWEWYQKHKLVDREFTDTRLVVSFVHGPGTLHARKPIRTMDELAGKKIRVGGSGVPIAKALGAAVVAMPATDAYEALNRGTVDGVFFPWEAMKSFRLNEMATYHLEIPGGMYSSSFGININPKIWAGLSGANKEALMKAGGLEGSKHFGKYWDAADKDNIEDAKSKKNTIETLSAAELPKWKKALEPVRQEWLDMAKGKGLDGAMLLKDFEDTVAKYAKGQS